jgi:Uma2 family endonuclease
MVAVKENFPRFTPEEYFAWEEQQNCRHEYLDGEVYAMTGGTLNHGRIAGNFYFILKAHLRGSGCQVGNSDCRVNIVASTDYTYPDLSVTCDERDRTNTQYITYPCLLVEVLSPGTEAYDRGNKFRMYRDNPDLQEYILVNSSSVAILVPRGSANELFRKKNGDDWQIINYQAGDSIELKSINLMFPIEQVYDEIIF